jgi:hypothetical protein
MIGKWEQIEQKAREDELTELERELHGEQERDGKSRRKGRHRRQQRRTEPGAPDAGTSQDNDTGGTANDG